MRSMKEADSRVRALLASHGEDGGDPEALIERLCADLLEMSGAELPVDLEMLASFRNAVVTEEEQLQAETVHWDGRRFRIRLRRADTLGRRRFSCAHAITHIWFFESDGLSDPSGGQAWSEPEEQLCDIGAAALLLPRDAFRAHCPPQPRMDDLLEVAERFESSVEATAIRAVAVSQRPLGMVVLERMLKPTERRLRDRRVTAPHLPGMEPPAPQLNLRVAKCWGRGLPYIPRYKSVAADVPLHRALDEGQVDYVGGIGVAPGAYRVSARNLPIRRDGEMVDRVVALVSPQIDLPSR